MISTFKARRGIAPNLPVAGAGQRIGLLGGSFNPAHGGHVQISAIAKARLGLDQVWWLVSPRNPLKSADDLTDLAERVAGARALAHSSFIRVTSLEAAIGVRYSIETIRYLQIHYGTVRFVWIVGADNLVIFHRWKCWREIAASMPIAVVDRPGAGLAATASRFATVFKRNRFDEADSGALTLAKPPAWLIIHGPLSPLSSTAIRRGV